MAQSFLRFIIISVPNGIAFRQFSSIIQLMKHVGDTYRAASYPPHVTLRTGAIVPIDQVAEFVSGFQRHIDSWNSFEMETDGIAMEETIGDGERGYFIYYRIKKNNDLLNLNQRLLAYSKFIKSQKKTFLPHLSLAYDDLTTVGYEKIKGLMASKKQLFPSSLKWKFDNISLYVQKGTNWIPYHVFRSNDGTDNQLLEKFFPNCASSPALGLT